jgi:membrane protease YdiL (CAAX protease family)
MNPIYQSKPVRLPSCIGVLFTLFLAAFFWWVIFGKEAVNFWLGMSVATSTLAALSLILGGRDFRRSLLKFPGSTTFWMGLASAVALYVVFEVGYFCSRLLFSTSPEEVSNIYTIRSKANPFVISLVLLFITSPCEEIFWRGFLQRWAVGRFGLMAGWILSTLLYSAVHIASGNWMLVMAAMVAGAFWGLLYLLTQNLWICILSHAFWTVLIFILIPIP